MRLWERACGRQNNPASPLDLTIIADEAVRLLRAVLPAGAGLVFSSASPLPSVCGDASQIHQVIINLVTNAWHALDGRNGRDTGRGIDASTLPRIFELFFSTKPAGIGTGLGLSIVHGIVHKQGGAIRVDSKPGVGTTICVYFPVVQQPAKAPEEPARPDDALGSGERILYVR